MYILRKLEQRQFQRKSLVNDDDTVLSYYIILVYTYINWFVKHVNVVATTKRVKMYKTIIYKCLMYNKISRQNSILRKSDPHRNVHML